MSYQAGDKVKIIGATVTGREAHMRHEGTVVEPWAIEGERAWRVAFEDGTTGVYYSNSLQPVPAFAVGNRVRVGRGAERAITAIYQAEGEPDVFKLSDGSVVAADEMELLPEPRTPKAGEVWRSKREYTVYLIHDEERISYFDQTATPRTIGVLIHREAVPSILKGCEFLAESPAAYFAQVSK